MNNVIYMYRCQDSTLVIKGKVNSVVIDSCRKSSIVFDSLVSSIEFVNCQSCQMQVCIKNQKYYHYSKTSNLITNFLKIPRPRFFILCSIHIMYNKSLKKIKELKVQQYRDKSRPTNFTVEN